MEVGVPGARDARGAVNWWSIGIAGLSAIQQQFAFALVARKGGGSFELSTCFRHPAELEKEVAMYGGHQVVGL